MRSSARMLPRTSPPMIASREITSPSTSPPFPTSTCRPARTVPTTVPSIFTTPSAVMSPTTRIPVPMMDSPASESSGPCPFSVNIAISVLLFHDREGIERLALAADFEVEVRRRGSPGVSGQGDHLPRLHRVAFAHQEARGVPIHGFIPARVPQEHEQSVGRVGAGRFDHTAPGRAHCGARGHGDVDAGMRFGGVARPHLAPGDEAGEVERPVRRLRRTRLVAQRRRRRTGAYRDRTHEVLGRGRPLFPRRPDAQHGAQLLVVRLGPVQRRGELLHATVLLLEPRHLALQDRKSTRLNSSHDQISYAVFCLKKKKNKKVTLARKIKIPAGKKLQKRRAMGASYNERHHTDIALIYGVCAEEGLPRLSDGTA